DHSGGFTQLTPNGSTVFNGSTIQLTDGGFGEASSAFANTPVNVTNFTTVFSFSMVPGTNPMADGMTFTIQNSVPGVDYSMSVVKMSTASGLSVADWFAPHDALPLSAADLDQGSGGVLILPDQPGAHPHLLVQTGKTGRIYLLDRDNLGKFNSVSDAAVQVLPDGTIGASFDAPAYFNNGSQQMIYYQGVGDVLKMFTLSNGLLSPGPAAMSTTSFGFPGATPSISANGTQNGIVWVLDNHLYGIPARPPPGRGVLHAYDATTLRELYNTSQNGLLDQLGNAVKFTVPTVTNGHVYVGNQYSFSVLGVFPTPESIPAAPSGLNAT